MKRASLALWVAIWAYVGYLIYDWANTPPKPKEMTTLDAVRIMSEAHNKQQRSIRQLKTELDHVKRQLAGELPQIHGGVSYD